MCLKAVFSHVSKFQEGLLRQFSGSLPEASDSIGQWWGLRTGMLTGSHGDGDAAGPTHQAHTLRSTSLRSQSREVAELRLELRSVSFNIKFHPVIICCCCSVTKSCLPL